MASSSDPPAAVDDPVRRLSERSLSAERDANRHEFAPERGTLDGRRHADSDATLETG